MLTKCVANIVYRNRVQLWNKQRLILESKLIVYSTNINFNPFSYTFIHITIPEMLILMDYDVFNALKIYLYISQNVNCWSRCEYVRLRLQNGRTPFRRGSFLITIKVQYFTFTIYSGIMKVK